jgi:twitching motility protein PilT
LTLNAAETGHLVLATLHSATCAEALSRLCMSFPAEIQGSIRAQLADCLVGVVCQRLEYLPQWQLRVPQCEVLLASSGAKGTIRAGQFGSLGNVIQSGGDEGMWTFDRYQRWVEQQRDWVRPAAPAAGGAEQDGVIRPAAARVSAPPGATSGAARAAVRTAASHASRAGAASGAGAQPAGRGVAKPTPTPAADAPEEITIDEDLDLEDIAELARRIERRTPE